MNYGAPGKQGEIMSTREDILTRIRSQKRSAMRSTIKINKADLADEFTKAVTDAQGEVIRNSSLNKSIQQFMIFCKDVAAKRIVINGDSCLDSHNLPDLMPDYEWFIAGRSQGDLRSFCASADIGVTGADAALAQTGSIAVSSAPHKSRLTTLLPTIHVAFVPLSCLLPDIFHWTAYIEKPVPSSVLLISGPSKTADIERVLTVGVHGPKRLVVFLYDD